MPDRLPCIVPFCRRTVPADRTPAGWEIICAAHWRAVPTALKAARRRAKATVRRLAAEDEAARLRFLACPEAQVFRPDGMHPLEAARLHAVHRLVSAENRNARLWRICKRRATEAAGGIG
ncbi:hypothetical protein [Lichenibacterium dinghuense]|uniref:hypothetical protein n=1 Tax=Lichenibacterium dinghuense TaxID=2895977 RepID=UPI001F2E722D|nr:hypothetical protein [Lichenibacterium sp. 6Y81]